MKQPVALLLPLILLSNTSFAAPKKEPHSPSSGTHALQGWIDWRGPSHNGTTPETGLPSAVDAKAPLWSVALPGQSTPVIANGKLYINGYLGDGPDLQEVIACYDAETGKEVWMHRFNDFLSDTIYLRYSTSSPTVDAETGNVYVQSTQGLFSCFTPDGKLLWQHSMMEEFGRLTFPNSRTASPTIDHELVITRGITSNWGAHGPAGDRFYAFDKRTGELVWTSAPGERPQDNTFSQPLLTWMDGQRVLISAGGDSTVVGINARTGDPIFRFPAAKAGAKGGINASILRHKDNLLVIHESENLDTSEVGRSAAYKLPLGAKSPEPGKPAVLESKDLEVWRNPLGNLASSPCLVGDRMYLVTGTGEVAATDVVTGKILWRKKLAPEQRQSSPMYGDGKLYVSVYIADSSAASASGAGDTGGNGELFVLKPTDSDAEILSRTILEGRCYGSPVPYNGKLYVQTDRKLYCFGKKGNNASASTVVAVDDWPKLEVGPAARLQVIPSEMLLKPGEAKSVRVRSLDANGFTVQESVDLKQVKFESYIPPTALVKAQMKGSFDAQGRLAADAAPVASAGAYQASLGDVKGTMRARVLPDLPLNIDFEQFELSQMTDNPPAPAVPNTLETPTAFTYPPLAWNSARFRFEVRKAPGAEGNKALCKTIDNKLFQRGQIFVGHPGTKNYTIEADVLTEGNKRKMSEVGLINQRYLVVLKGNSQSLEVSSNQERLRESVPFSWVPNQWYHLKSRVDVAADGSGVVRAKVWKKEESEPAAWTIEVPHKTVHTEGAPGLFSFTPQEQRAWIDNISVTPNLPEKH
ncbi:MAG: PQQ-binding-like beta-propeller repeat protein [Verrucomicrobiota bacterium]